MILATSTQRAFGFVIPPRRRGDRVRRGSSPTLRAGAMRIGSEIELAPNRSPQLTDDELEGHRLNVALFSALGLFRHHRRRPPAVLAG